MTVKEFLSANKNNTGNPFISFVIKDHHNKMVAEYDREAGWTVNEDLIIDREIESWHASLDPQDPDAIIIWITPGGTLKSISMEKLDKCNDEIEHLFYGDDE